MSYEPIAATGAPSDPMPLFAPSRRPSVALAALLILALVITAAVTHHYTLSIASTTRHVRIAHTRASAAASAALPRRVSCRRAAAAAAVAVTPGARSGRAGDVDSCNEDVIACEEDQEESAFPGCVSFCDSYQQEMENAYYEDYAEDAFLLIASLMTSYT